MKKYLLMFLVTTVIILGITYIPKIIIGRTVSVSLMTISPSRAESTVICSGKIEYSEVNSVYVKSPSIVEKVNIKVGDTVNSGDTLFDVTGAIESPSKQGDFSKNESTDLNSLSNISDVYNYMLNSQDKKNILNKNYVSDNKVTQIKSPFSGIVSSVAAKEKDAVESGTSLCSISNKDKLQVKAEINESQISDIKVGQTVFISGLGFKNSEYKGKVIEISNEARQTTNPAGQETVVDVIILIDPPVHDVKPGFTAKCRIVTEEKDGVIIVPYESIKTDKHGRDYVYIFSENVAKKTFITLGREFENGVEIVSGLNFDDQVITDSEKIFNGEKLVPILDSEEKND